MAAAIGAAAGAAVASALSHRSRAKRFRPTARASSRSRSRSRNGKRSMSPYHRVSFQRIGAPSAMMRAPGRENGNIKLKRQFLATPSTRTAATSEVFSLTFQSIPDYADYQAIYNRFRITYVEIKCVPYINSASNASLEYTSAGVLNSYHSPRFDMVGVYDGGSTTALASIAEGLEKGGRLLDGRTYHTFGYVPNIIQADGSIKKAPWLDISDNATDVHYGLKFYVDIPPQGWATPQIFNTTNYHITLHVEISLA